MSPQRGSIGANKGKELIVREKGNTDTARGTLILREVRFSSPRAQLE